MPRLGLPLRFVVLLSLALGACSGIGAPAFEATFPPSSDGVVDGMDVSVIDQTGLVTGMTLAVATGEVLQVVGEPGDPNAVRIEWPGNDCDGRTSLVINPSGSGYEIALHIDPTPAGGFGCQNVDSQRALTLHLREPVAPERFTINPVFP